MKMIQRNNRDKMLSLVEEYLLGGITQKELSDREGLKLGTFKYWYRKYHAEQLEFSVVEKSVKKSSSSDFIPISVPDFTTTTPSKLELSYPNGVRLQLNIVLDMAGLSTVKQLVSCLD